MKGEKAYGGWRDLLPLGTVIAIGLVLAAGAFLTTRAYYAGREQQQFRRDATYYETKFKDDLARHVTSLAAIRAFVSATRSVSRWEFSTYANQILPLNAGFKAVLWVPSVTQAQRAAYEAQLQSDGLYGLQIHELTAQGMLVPATDRPSYRPISYVEPFNGNDTLVGLDLSQIPRLSELFQTAEQTGRVAASAPLLRPLVSGTEGPVVLLAFPLSSTSAADAPRGFALGVLQLQAIVQEVLGSVASPVQVALADPQGPSPLLLSSNVTARDWLGGAELHHSTVIKIAGRRFQLLLRATSHQDPVTIFYVPAGAALLVIALTILLAQTMFATVLRNRLVERAVVARTAQLRAANEALSDEIDHRRQAEQDLRVARDRAESASRAKSSFLAIMSHELRTPLNAIIGFSGLLAQNGCAVGHEEEYGREILGSGQRLLGIVNDILDLTEMTSKPQEPRESLVYLGDCIAAAVIEGQPAARAVGVTLKAAIPAELPALYGDNKRICRALAHLVSNAVKFTSEGGAAVITARLEADQSVVVDVMDNGIGMSPETRERIREGFSQSDSRLGRRHEGLGLGLTYVSRVAEFHHAKFDIVSEIGKGTRARLVFAPDTLSKARGGRMKIKHPTAIALALALAACSQTPKAAPPAPAPVAVEAPPPAAPPVQAAPSIDAATIAAAQRNLRALGYPAGKSSGLHDSGLRRAILAFEKDQGLAEDGQLSPALEERLGQLRGAMLKKAAAQTKRSAVFVYSDGTVSGAGLSPLPVPAGFVSDAPADLLKPMHPGAQASYHLGHRGPDGGLSAASAVTCHVGHIAPANTVFGTADVLPVDCHVEDGAGQDWHTLYSPMLDAVVQQQGGGKNRTLVAIRPSTASWPLAARTGLDWAVTHALETPAPDVAVSWSSTAVAQHFEVRAFGKISGAEKGLSGALAKAGCRRFELDDDAKPPSRYPGVACQKDSGNWALAGTAITLSAPAKAIGAHPAGPSLRSAQN